MGLRCRREDCAGWEKGYGRKSSEFGRIVCAMRDMKTETPTSSPTHPGRVSTRAVRRFSQPTPSETHSL